MTRSARWGRQAPVLPTGKHPDSRVDAQLEQIRSLRRAVARKEAAAQKAYSDMADIRKKATVAISNGHRGRGASLAEYGDEVQATAANLDTFIRADHEAIAALMAGLDDSDLAFL